MRSRSRIVLFALAAGIGAGALGMTLVNGDGRVADSPSTQAAADRSTPADEPAAGGDSERLKAVVESLVAMLDQEISERQVLAEEIRELQDEVDRLQRSLGSGNVPLDNPSRVSGEFRRQRQAPASRAERLQAAGFSERDVKVIERRTAAATMQQMALDDRARREGWINTPRYFEEFQALESGADSVRGYLGDEAYDRYLFATGSPNRLSIQSVVATSPAEQAGLQPGDVLVSYGDERVFSTRQLIELRSGGEPGQSVAVEIIRDGEAVDVMLPRGPIGIRTVPDLVDPAGDTAQE